MTAKSPSFIYEEGLTAVTRAEDVTGILEPNEVDSFYQGVMDGISIRAVIAEG